MSGRRCSSVRRDAIERDACGAWSGEKCDETVRFSTALRGVRSLGFTGSAAVQDLTDRAGEGEE